MSKAGGDKNQKTKRGSGILLRFLSRKPNVLFPLLQNPTALCGGLSHKISVKDAGACGSNVTKYELTKRQPLAALYMWGLTDYVFDVSRPTPLQLGQNIGLKCQRSHS